MKRLNIQLEEQKFQKLKLVALVEKKSVAAVLRDAADAYLETKTDLKEKVSEVFYADDEAFKASVQRSFETFDPLYRKLAK